MVKTEIEKFAEMKNFPQRGKNIADYVTERFNISQDRHGEMKLQTIFYSAPFSEDNQIVGGRAVIDGLPCEFSYNNQTRDLKFSGPGDTIYEAKRFAKSLGGNLEFKAYK